MLADLGRKQAANETTHACPKQERSKMEIVSLIFNSLL